MKVEPEASLNHPADDTLRALSLGQLTEAELARISAHLTECPACCSRIDQLAGDDSLLTRLRRGAAGREEMLVGPSQRRPAVRALRQPQGAISATRADMETAAGMLTAPKRVGDYEILGPLGAGGMGQVFCARDVKLDRRVAIKMLRDGSADNPAWMARFDREARLLAALTHANIATVYGLGEVEGLRIHCHGTGAGRDTRPTPDEGAIAP